MAEAWREIPERWTYDAFLSFHGPDVRKGFVSYLYKSLVNVGIYTFKDDEKLEIGESFPSELLKAIENSKVHVVVLSANYASSAWCLDELSHIMECNDSKRRGVIPIFYNVDPSHVRRQNGSYGASFSKHKSRYPESKVRKWKTALTDIANLSGFVTSNHSDEQELVEKVTKEIRRRVSISYLQLPAYPVGIRQRVKRIYELMSFGSDDVQTIGICGMGGIGKTTLAKAACNEFSDSFEGISFLENFGEYSKKTDGKVYLQRKLLSDIIRRHDIVFDNLDHEVKHRFRNKRVLVVIDDAEDMKQLNSVAIDLSCFGPGSRIIITTKNEHLLKQLRIKNIYSPEPLNNEESLELVSRHAFRTNEPPESFLHLSKKLVKYCGGLPLAVEVVSAFLFERSTSQWENTLEQLKEIPDADVQAKLRVSFDALIPVQQDIFLDISCFFIGMDKDYVSCILDGCKLYPEIGLAVLKERCLITVRDNMLMMHDLLRDMGRQIIREKDTKNCESWSRLWDCDKIINVLKNDIGTDAIEGLSLKAPSTIVENFEVKAFSNLRKLRLLQFSNVSLNGSYENFPKVLRWVCWFKFPMDSIPAEMHLGNLVVMDLQYSNLKRFCDDRNIKPQVLEHLKYLDLSHSMYLTDTPDFSYLPNLEKLLLINCQRLVRIHNSIGILHKKLVHINLRGCNELSHLPLELYKLQLLETLILSGCSKLERLDDALGEMKSLKTLKADYTGLTYFPSSTDRLKNLEELSLDGCKDLWKPRNYRHSLESAQAAISTPLSFSGLSCLKILRLASCNLSDELIPKALGCLTCLEELDLGGNNFCNLQIELADLKVLQIIRLDSCSELRSMPILPKKLRSLYARNCITLEKTPDLSECSVLQSLYLTNCSNLVETPGLDKLKTVGIIHMEMCNRIPATYRERIMQGWAVNANGGVFIPGSSLPSWVSYRNEMHSISFIVPEALDFDLVGFTLWTSYMCQQNDVVSEYTPKITVKNQTKGDVWSRSPAADQIHMYRENHIWQGHFSNGDFFLETDDHVEISVDFGDQVTILETGVTLAYREEVDDQLTQANDEVDNERVIEVVYREEVNAIPDDQLIQTDDASNQADDEVDNERVLEVVYREEVNAILHNQLIQTDDASTQADDEVYNELAIEVVDREEVNPVPDDQSTPTDDAMIQADDEVDNERAIEESRSRPCRIMGMGLKTLLGAFGLLAFIVIVGKHGRPLRIRNHNRGEKDKKEDDRTDFLFVQGFRDY